MANGSGEPVGPDANPPNNCARGYLAAYGTTTLVYYSGGSSTSCSS
jgi:hypothetical protein